jgi:flavin reductase (DIM6/NTAB) family NADH-FMN oxidoreductase RutF
MEKKTIDPKQLRSVASCFATGVSVVSVINPEGAPHGMTASSFLSVSLDPPLVLFSLMNQNQMADYIKVGDPLGISILTEEMEGVSNHFAKMATLDPAPEFILKQAAPILENAHAWYATVIEQLIQAGDHVLVLCRVIDLAAFPEKYPLIYYQGYKNIT